jgi:hypothetical protein
MRLASAGLSPESGFPEIPLATKGLGEDRSVNALLYEGTDFLESLSMVYMA